MPVTRSGAKKGGINSNANGEKAAKPVGSKRKLSTTKKDTNGGKDRPENVPQQDSAGTKGTKAAKQEKDQSASAAANKDNSKLETLLDDYGTFPLSNCGLKDPKQATAQTVLAHLFHAMLTSARTSYGLATKSVKTLIEKRYHDIEILKKSSWEERTKILTDGGYMRYRERTATQLGELAELIDGEYQGDLNKLREAAADDPKKIRKLVKEVKGIGDIGVNIFQDTIQAIWPCMAPYLDPRNEDTAKDLGIGSDIQTMWESVRKDPAKMATLCSALTIVRLEKKQDEFKDDEGDSE